MASSDTTSTQAARTKKSKASTAKPATTSDASARANDGALQPPPGAPELPVELDGALVQGAENLDLPAALGYSDAQWQAMVAEAAYLRAERRGFKDGTAEQDWLEAEEELRRNLRGPLHD
jgi:hypothetical protein